MKIDLSRIRESIIRPVPAVVPILLFACVLLCFQLFSLVKYGGSELAQKIGSANLSQLYNDVLFLPIKGTQLTILKFTENDTFIRLASVFAALVSVYFLFLLLQKWQSLRISVMTILMYITSTLFLHAGRDAGTDVLYLSVIPVLFVVCLWFLSKHHDNKLPLAAILLGIILYIPGSIILLIAGLFAFRKYVFKNFTKLSLKIRLSSVSAFLLTLAPLIYSSVHKPEQLIRWLGFDNNQELTYQAIGRHFLEIPDQLFFSGFNDPAKWLVGTPIFDVFAIAMFCLGIYAYRVGHYPAREKLVFSLAIIVVLLIGFGNVATVTLLIPLMYIAIANGLAYMLQSWFTVFPRNPLARSTGIVLLSIVIGLSCIYQLQRYYIAWPRAEATKTARNS